MIRPPIHRRRRPRPWLLALALTLAACGASGRRVASSAVALAGGGLSVVHRDHQRAYVQATDALIARLRAADGTVADYDRESAPLTATFRARGLAIQALDGQLFAAARIIDASKTGDRRAWAKAAAALLAALDLTLAVLADGAVLPAVPVPPEVREVVDVLRGLAALAGGG